MKRVHSLILFLMFFVGASSIAMDCDLCYEPISTCRPRISMCPNDACAQAHTTCKVCLLDWLTRSNVCPHACGCNLVIAGTGIGNKNSINNKPTNNNKPPQKPSAPITHIPPALPKHNKDIEKLFSLGSLTVLSIAALPWTLYHWSKYRLQSTLYAINHAAHAKTNTLLRFEFDCDNGAAFLSLQESFDVASILQSITSEKKRVAIQTAIEHYDIASRNAHDRIVSTYYYQPVANFEQKEPQLVQELTARTEQVNRLITDYTRELGSPMGNVLLGVGACVLSGIGIFNIIKS